MTGLWTIAKRELQGFFHTPIAYVLGVAFLAIQGFSFWALMRSLSDPRAPAEAGAVLRSFFGGTLLHWFTVFALVALLAMRSVAEDRRSGVWEATLTTRVRASTVLLGKWLALVSFYLLLWLPSLFLVYVFTLYLPEGQTLDLGPVFASYLGIAGIGAALLAIGVALSTATENQIIAAVLSFSLYLAWLMLGEYGGLAGGASGASNWLLLLDLRQSLSTMARGEVSLATLVSLGFISALSLVVATALAANSRAAKIRLCAAALALCVAGGSLAHLTGRHVSSLDWSASRSNSLEEATEAVLGQLTEKVDVVVVRPTEQVFDPVHEEITRLLRRMQSEQSLLRVHELDPLAEPGKVAEWAFELAIRPEDLSSGGAVIFKRGASQRVVDLLAMASFAADDLGVGALAEFRAESAFREAIREVVRVGQETLCVSAGHRELPMRDSGANWSAVAKRMEKSGVVMRSLSTLSMDTLGTCDALAIMGATRGFEAEELLALSSYWAGGGHTLIAMASRPELGEQVLPSTGLRLLLQARGMQVLDALVVDPAAELELKPAWMTYEGYAKHPIVVDFYQRRATVWDAPLGLQASRDDVTWLVRASEQGWAETDWPALLREGEYERGPEESRGGHAAGPAVALAQQDKQGARLVLIGGVETFSSTWSERGIGGNDRFLASSLLWILDRNVELQSQDKRPEYLRLLMSKAQLKSAFVWCVVVGPLFFALFGAGLWWWRRREE